MNHFKVVFFGSFQNYSVQVLEKLLNHAKLFEVVGIVTTPPKPAGREQELKPTEVQVFAQEKKIPVFALESLDKIPHEIAEKPDFIVVAGYGKLIPPQWLGLPKITPINVHFSLLPNYPGRFPAEWAILMGEIKTGVTIIKMSPKFDKGEILTQKEIPIEKTDTRETLYKKLYGLGGDLAVETLPKFDEGRIKSIPQDLSRPHKYARQITREDGFIPWDIFLSAVQGQALDSDMTPLFKEIGQVKDISTVSVAELIERMLRAFDPWPGVWTLNQGGSGQAVKRLKILKGHLERLRLVIDSVQLEGRSLLKGQDATNYLNGLLSERKRK